MNKTKEKKKKESPQCESRIITKRKERNQVDGFYGDGSENRTEMREMKGQGE